MGHQGSEATLWYTTNDNGEFSSSYKYIYPKQLEIKTITSRGTCIVLENGHEFVYKLFDKTDKFPFFVVYMPYLSSNIPPSISYSSIFSEFLQIAQCTLRSADFVSKASQLYTRMVT